MIEAAGIPTVSVTMLKEVTAKVDPPRALFVDTPLGYPLGEPHDPALRKRMIDAALALLAVREGLPVVEDFPLEGGRP